MTDVGSSSTGRVLETSKSGERPGLCSISMFGPTPGSGTTGLVKLTDNVLTGVIS